MNMDHNGQQPLGMCKMKMYFSGDSMTMMVHHLLFKKWSIHTDDVTKYVFSTLFVFLLCFVNQFITFLIHVIHKKWSNDKHSAMKRWVGNLTQPILFFFNVANGFLIMLILMTYNFGLCMALLGGNVIGYTFFTVFLQEYLLESGKLKGFHIQNSGYMNDL